MDNAKAWFRAGAVVLIAVLVYVAASVLTAFLTGSAVWAMVVAGLAVGALALAYRSLATGSLFAPVSSRASATWSVRFWVLVAAGLLTCWLSGQLLAMGLYNALGDAAFDRHDAALAQAPALLVIVAVLLVAPYGEESLMRGIVYPALRERCAPWVAALVSTGVFALLHGNLVQIVLVLPLGFLLAFVRERTGSLWPAVLVHAVFNLLSTVVPVSAVQALAQLPVIGAVALVLALLCILSLYPNEDSERTLPLRPLS